MAPLPIVKVWYEVSVAGDPTVLERPITIADLKSELCKTLFNNGTNSPTSPLSVSLTAANLVLELDEFELLDSSALGVIRENDLLM